MIRLIYLEHAFLKEHKLRFESIRRIFCLKRQTHTKSLAQPIVFLNAKHRVRVRVQYAMDTATFRWNPSSVGAPLYDVVLFFST